MSRGFFGLVALCVFGLVAFLGISASPALAVDNCPNAAFRTGPSANLPDCRALELVTPGNTGSLRPLGANFSTTYSGFASQLLSPSNDSLIFHTVAGALSGSNGTGYVDRYEANRGPDGWTTQLIGPTADQTQHPSPGGISPDHDYYFLGFEGTVAPDYGSLNTPNLGEAYIRLADGSFEPIGQGSLGVDPYATGWLITPGATHVLFDTRHYGTYTAQQLEPDAAPTYKTSIYDRTPDGVTHVVSLLPGNVPTTEDSFPESASADGSVVLFDNPDQSGLGEIINGAKLYARVNNSATYELADSAAGEVKPGGVSSNGRYAFWVQNGNVYTFDTTTQLTDTVTTAGDAELANVSADGSRVYFVSAIQIGGQGQAGQPNLYLWDRSTSEITFVATVDPADVTHDDGVNNTDLPGLTRWSEDVATSRVGEEGKGPGSETSRSTPDGSVIVFESHAALTAFDNAGHNEVYRYDAAQDSVSCVSCGPGVGPATADASLQTINFGVSDRTRPVSSVYPTPNLTTDGQTVFFQTKEALLPGDSGTAQDVYEWHAGELSRISSGQSAYDNYLYAASADGSDVLFETNDNLLPQDKNTVGAIYDARVDGGFPVGAGGPGPCIGDACQGNPTPPPSDLAGGGSSTFSGPGNRRRSHGTSRSRKKCRKHGKKHKKCKKSRRANATRRAGR